MSTDMDRVPRGQAHRPEPRRFHPRGRSGEGRRRRAADGDSLTDLIGPSDARLDSSVIKSVSWAGGAAATMRRVWAEQHTDEPGRLRWREVKDRPSPGGLIRSPYDPKARYGAKCDLGWVGCKTHQTEPCDEDRPRRIVDARDGVGR